MIQSNQEQGVAAWIQTLYGYAFDFDCMDHNVFDPEEVAEILSRTLRFSGHTKWPFSVAQHSVLMMREQDDGVDRLVALLHDVPEVFIGDITAPLKHYLRAGSPDLADLEQRIWEWIASIHGFPPEYKDCIRESDLRALATEARDLMESPPRPWIPLPRTRETRVEPWLQAYARDEWLRCYAALGKPMRRSLQQEAGR